MKKQTLLKRIKNNPYQRTKKKKRKSAKKALKRDKKG